MSKQRLKIVVTMIVTVVIGLVGYYVKVRNHSIVLELGMFAESNWGVESADAYVVIDDAIKRFEESHLGVKVHYESGIRKNDYSEWLARKTLQGNTPDVFMILSEDFYRYASLGVLKGLDNQIANDSGFRKNYFYKSILDMGSYEQGQYALPYEVVPKLMFVNKTLLNNAGITMPELDWTWDNLEDIAKAVTKDTDGDGRVDQFGICNYTWKEAVYANGVTLFDDNGKEANFSNSQVIEAVQFVKNLGELNMGVEVGHDDFNSGRVAFMPLAFSDYRTYKTYPYRIRKYSSFQWECITMPAGPGGENTSEVDALLVGTSRHSRHQELAWEFMKLLTTDSEVQRKLFKYSQGASALEYVTGSRYAESIIRADMDVSEKVIDYKLLSGAIKNGRSHPQFGHYQDVMALAESRIAQIYKEEKNVNSSLKILQRDITKYLKK